VPQDVPRLSIIHDSSGSSNAITRQDSAGTKCMARYQVVGLRAALELWRYCFDSAAYLFGDRLGATSATAFATSSAAIG
jgi:hypothetical protein